MSGKSSSASALILGLGLTAAFSLSFMFYNFFWKTKPTQKKILPPVDDSAPTASSTSSEEVPEKTVTSSVEVNEPSATAPTATAAAPAASSPTQVVMEEEEDSDEDDDNEEEAAAAAALKTAYDDALRLAKKLLAGEKYFKAAEKFTEAIKLAEELGGSASNDITTLYNNRSAMYEKCGELELALSDIGLVLAMEALHLKARIRRARIYEVQDKIKSSCVDYMVGMLIEMTKGVPPSHQEKIEALVKVQAVSETQAVVDSIRNSDSRELPSKAHCRNYFDTFPSYHRWRAAHTSATADRDTLVQAVTAAGGSFSDEEGSDTSTCEVGPALTARLTAVHTLACFDIANGSFNKATAAVNKACAFINTNKPSFEEQSNTELGTVIADLFSLHGTFYHLRANFSKAKECFSYCLDQQSLPEGFENALRLASVHLEVDSIEDASRVYDSVEASLAVTDGETPSSCDLAWLQLHRMSEWVTRDSGGKYRPQAIEMAIGFVRKALDATSDFGDDMVKKGCHLMALLKMIQLLSQTKIQMGLQPDNDDLAQQKQCIEKSIELFPQHDTVLMLGADLLSQEGRFDEAMAACDQMQANSKDPNDAILIVIKANVVCQMGMVKYAEAQEKQSQQIVMEAQQLLAQGQELYAEAIKAEPNSIEALIQLAQLKSMMGAGEMEEALALCKQALPHARSRDEALDILHLKLMMENRLIAINEMRDNGMQI